MTEQRIENGSIVSKVILIAIGIVIGVGISIGVGIGRIDNRPASISQGVGERFEQQVLVRADVRSVVAVERAARVERLGSTNLVRVAQDVVNDLDNVGNVRLLI